MSGFKSKRQMARDRFSTEVNEDYRIITRSITGILLIIFIVALIV
jgi:hypothetical protein